ncbi:MAG: hypothetical protein NWE93_00685 [Candidatus Bathyarchaeota archaeon]|nr:hypothetical protein [Candidatus Bathyarchaeota archaeon]
MTWEENQQTIKGKLKNPHQFQEETLKTVTLNQRDGIEALVGKPHGKQALSIQSYIFSKEHGWTLEKAKAWFSNLHGSPEHVCAPNVPFSVEEKMLEAPLRISGLAMTVGMSRNFNIYTAEELQSFAEKLTGAPIYLEHVTAQDAVGKVTKTQWDGQNLLYEAEIYDEAVAEKVRRGLIRHVSVGADYQSVDVVNGKVPHGLCNAEMSLVAVPGVANANIEVLEHLQEQLEPQVAGNYILGFSQDASAFMPEHYSTLWLDREAGVLALMGKPKSDPDSQRTAAIFFSKEHLWDQNRIRDWLSAHPAYLTLVAASQPPTDALAESLLQKCSPAAIPIGEAIRLIEEVLPSSIVQRSWSLGPQRMCQELGRVLYRLRKLQNSSHKELTAST